MFFALALENFCIWIILLPVNVEGIMSLFLQKGEFFSGCEIISRCGEGSFGVTYLAKNPIGQRIAIKIISSPLSREQELKGIRHYMKAAENFPCLLKIYHIGEMESGFYYIMEAADDCGENGIYRPATLHNIFKNINRFTPERAVGVVRELLAALQVLHDAKLIHRDIKPDNIVFVNSKAKLSDPGLVTEVGKTVTLAGTVGFIPPEIVNGEAGADETSDLYALGKVFYCMVTGYKPQQYPALPPDMRIEVCRQLYPVLSRVCNRNPAKRFKTAEEFLAGLPEKIGEPTRWEKMRESFRDWKICNRELWRAVVIAFFLLAVVGSTGVTTAIWQVWKYNRNSELARVSCEEFIRKSKKRGELLELQLETYLPEKLSGYTKLKQQFDKFFKEKNWNKALVQQQKLRQYLAGCAAMLAPEFPDGKSDFASSLEKSGKMYGFKNSPVFDYLDDAARKKFNSHLAGLEKNLYTNWQGPRCDRNWLSMQYHYMSMSFVPPGVCRDSRTGEKIIIPYHYWMGQFEVGESPLTSYLKINPKKTGRSNTPMERLGWNDMLFYCRQLTWQLKNNGALPPGYIVRPPTEDEWFYAANNAMLGKEEGQEKERIIFRDNSGGVPHPSGTLRPNRLGLFDMYGNMSEVVIPRRNALPPDLLYIRGGSYLNSLKSCFRQRTPYPKYQTIPYDIGFRLAIAPGDESFYDENFFLIHTNRLRSDNKVYELIGANFAVFDRKNALALAALLGGKPAEFENEAEVERVMKAFPLITSWESAIGGEFSGNKWLWYSGKPVDFGKWNPHGSKDKDAVLALKKGKWSSVKRDYKMPVMICQWSEKEFTQMSGKYPGNKKLPLELTRFDIGNRRYVLFDIKPLFCTAQHCCELMGGSLVSADDPELLKQLIEKLFPFRKKHILLGGYAKWDKWFWLSGKEFKGELLKNPGDQTPRRNLNFITLCDGKLYDSQMNALMLCEWQKK